MRIISNFRDYYDNIQGYGQDPKLVYNRYETEIKLNNDIFLMKDDGIPIGNFYDSVFLSGITVFFCGKEYKAFEYYNTKTTEKTYIWNYNQFESFVIKYGDKAKKWFYNDRVYLNYKVRKHKIHRYKSYMELFEPKNTKESIVKIHIENKTPIIYSYQGSYSTKFKIKKDINLSKIDFVKVVDPFTAFQEISMFISGYIGINENPMIEISDKDKIVEAGFDIKSSFRHPYK